MKNRFSNFILYISTEILVVSCSFKEEEDKEKIQKDNTKQVIEVLKSEDNKVILNSKNVKFSVSGNEKVGLYDVHITWPKEVQKMRVLVEGHNPIIVNQISGYSFVAGASRSYSVHFTAMDNLGRELNTYEERIRTPYDLIISDARKLTEDTIYHYDRILIEKNGKIITDGFKLVLLSKELHLEDKIDVSKAEELGAQRFHPHIVTYYDNYIFLGTNTPIPPAIEVNSQKAYGTLVIHAFGADGQKGLDGIDADQAHDPSLDAPIPSYVVVPKFISAGLDSRSERYCEIKSNDPPVSGKKGKQGGGAGNGGSGGDAPLSILNIEDVNNFKAIVVSRPGKGGNPGMPGKGGPGGYGANYLSFDDSCNVIKSSKKSTDGEFGDSGPTGQRGVDGSNRGVQSNLSDKNLRYITLLPGRGI